METLMTMHRDNRLGFLPAVGRPPEPARSIRWYLSHSKCTPHVERDTGKWGIHGASLCTPARTAAQQFFGKPKDDA